MQKSATRIRTSHVGRLPAPKGWEDMPARPGPGGGDAEVALEHGAVGGEGELSASKGTPANPPSTAKDGELSRP